MTRVESLTAALAGRNLIVSRSVDGVVSGRYGSTVAGAPSVVLNASNQPISATVGLLGGVNHSYDPTVAAVNGRGITRT
jgi:hypothetical protein